MVKHPIPVEILISVVVWTIWFLAVVGNALVFLVVLLDKRLRSIVANVYILNLAGAGLCTGVVSLTLNNLTRYFDSWPFGKAVCAFWVAVDYSTYTQTAYAVVLISLDRYWMVTQLLHYRKYQRFSLAVGLTAASWTLSLLLQVIPLLVEWTRPPGSPNDTHIDYSIKCDFKVLYNLINNIVQILVGFIVPGIALVYLNLHVYLNILRRSRGLVRTGRQSLSFERHPSENPQNNNNNFATLHDSRQTYRKHRKSAVTLAIIVGVFYLTSLPYYVTQFIFIVSDQSILPDVVWNATYYAAWFNAAVNPFIYATTNPQMRRGFVRICCCSGDRFRVWRKRRVRPM